MKFKVGDRVRFVPSGTEHREYQNLKGGEVFAVTHIKGALFPYEVHFDEYNYHADKDGYNTHLCKEEELEHEV